MAKSNKKHEEREIKVNGYTSLDEISDAFGYGEITDDERYQLVEQFENKEGFNLEKSW